MTAPSAARERHAQHQDRALARRITSKLDSIDGVGPAKRRALLRSFASVAAVAAASVDQ